MFNRPKTHNPADIKATNTTSEPASVKPAVSKPGLFATVYSAMTKPSTPLTKEEYILIATSFPSSM